MKGNRQPSGAAGRIVLSVILTIGIRSMAQAQWEYAAPMPAPKANTFAVTFQGDVYMVGGAPWVNGGDLDGSVYRLSNGVWTVAAPLDGMGPAVGQGGGVDALGRILVFGGEIQGSGDLAESRVYEPIDGTFGIPAEASLVNPRLNFGLAVDDQHRIYRLGGGCDICNNNQSICSRYDAVTDSWEQIAWLPWSRSSIAAVYDGRGHIWAFGGYTSFGLPRLIHTIRYTIATDTWETLGSLTLPMATSDARAVLGADGKLYFIGGLTGDGPGTPTSAVYVLALDDTEPSWRPGPSLQTARYDFGVTLGDDQYIYVIGGMTTSGPTATVERLYTGAVPALPGDINGDCAVDIDDLNALLGAWATTVGVGSPLDPANDDGFVDADDLNLVLANWGAAC